MPGPPDRLDDVDDRHHRADRIREQLQASHERFTTVLEALDASVSVAPGSEELLLFANKLYRLWFGVPTGAATCRWWRRPAFRSTAQRRVARRRRFLRRPAHRTTLTAALRERRDLRARAGQVAGSAFALPELGGRPPGADGDRHRHHAAPQRRGAGRGPGRTRAVRQPPDHHGRDGLQRGARTEPAAHGHQQLLQRPWSRASAASRSARTTCWRRWTRRRAGAARRPDHPAHPHLREAQRAEPHAVRRERDGDEALELAEIELRRRNVRMSHYVAARLPS